MMIHVPLNQIRDNPYQKRKIYDEIDKLAAAIKAARPQYPATGGLMQLPRARVVDDDGELAPIARLDNDEWLIAHPQFPGAHILRPGWLVQLAFGHRRKRAFDELSRLGPTYDSNYYYMPLHVDDLTDDQMIDAVWSENYDRKDISAVEQAELLAAKLERPKTGGGSRSQRDVADEWGLDRSTIANRLSLLQLPADVQQANRTGALSERQCLALKPIVQAQAALNGTVVNWSKKFTGYEYDAPISPQDYIARVLENPATTSDEIRNYGKRILRHAGHSLPATISQFAVESRHVRQSLCAGCKLRVNETCLDEKCVDTKKAEYGRSLAQAAAIELGLPFSDNPDDFAPYREWSKRGELEQVREGGVCPHLVVGWEIGNHGLRPFTNGNSYAPANDSVFEDGSRVGVAIGHRGDIQPECCPPKEEAKEENVPDQKTIAAWNKRSKSRSTTIKTTIKQVLAEKLTIEIDQINGLFVLAGLKAVGTDDPRAAREKLVADMMDRGSLKFTSDLVSAREIATGVLQAAGIPSAETVLSAGSPALDAEDQAIVALAHWYERRSYAGSYAAKASLPRIEAARALVEPYRAALAETAAWLDAAYEEIQEKAQEG